MYAMYTKIILSLKKKIEYFKFILNIKYVKYVEYVEYLYLYCIWQLFFSQNLFFQF